MQIARLQMHVKNVSLRRHYQTDITGSHFYTFNSGDTNT